MTGAELEGTPIPRRELLTLLAYVESGGHKAAAYRLGTSVSTSRQRLSRLIKRVGASNATQAVWRLRDELAAEEAQLAAARQAQRRPGTNVRP